MSTPAHQVTLTAGLLRDMLTAALTGVSRDEFDQKFFRMIIMEAGNGRITATSTDRYVLVHAVQPATGTLPRIAVPSGPADRMLKLLADISRDETAALDLDGTQLTLNTPLGSVVGEIPAELPTMPVNLLGLLDPAGYRKSTLTGPIGMSADLLARIAKATETSGNPGTVLYFKDPQKPVRIEVADWLTMLIMPVYLHDNMLGGPRNTAGLPESPAPVQLPDPAQVRDVTWPKEEPDATAARLIRWFSASMLRSQHRVLHEDWPHLPPYDQQNPEQRAIAMARADLHNSVVDNFAIAHLLTAFAAAAPVAADAAARELWNQIDAGDGLGENTWEWLNDAGVDPNNLPFDLISAARHERADVVHRQVLAAGEPPATPAEEDAPAPAGASSAA